MDTTLISLLSTQFGPSRRKFVRMLSSPDIDRTRRDALTAFQISQDVLRRAVAAACALTDPHLTTLLVSWLLREGWGCDWGQDQQRNIHERHDHQIELMVLALPQNISNDARLHAALASSSCVRGCLVLKLLQIRNGDLSFRDAVRGLGAYDAAVLVGLYACQIWATKRQLLQTIFGSLSRKDTVVSSEVNKT
jgi:hypothetical protein